MVTFRFDVSTQVDLLSELIHTVEKACVPHATNVCVFFVLDCYYIFDWNSPHVPFFSLRIRSERLAWAAGLSARFTLAASTRRAFQRFPQLAPASSGQRGCYAACIVEPHETRFPPFRRCVLESNHAMLRKKRIVTRHFPVFSCRVVPESLTEAFRIRSGIFLGQTFHFPSLFFFLATNLRPNEVGIAG
jgi:hypothetical protein